MAIFTYNRPVHARRLLASLERCRDLDFDRVHIFCDGAKSGNDLDQVIANRQVVNQWALKVGAHVVERENNIGLAGSIVGGVDYFCNQDGSVIVLEDDLVVAPDFIQYMDAALDRYAQEKNVYQVSGYNFPRVNRKNTGACFLPLTTSWGWATWKRAWQHYSRDTSDILDDTEQLHALDLHGAYPFSEILQATLAGKAESWAVFWRLSVFRANGLVLYPPRSLVWQGGFDGSGVHCGNPGTGRVTEAPAAYREPRLPGDFHWPDNISVSKQALEQARDNLKNHTDNKNWASGGQSMSSWLIKNINKLQSGSGAGKRPRLKIPLLNSLMRNVRILLADRQARARLRKLKNTGPLRLVIGASGIYENGWIDTDSRYLNLLNPEQWQNYFHKDSIDAILAEHVWEHLTREEGLAAARLCHVYLRPGGYLRVAVPDGYHPDQDYINYVKPGGCGPGADDHRVLYNYNSFSGVFAKAGFRIVLLEYFDRKGRFHFTDWDPGDGKIIRSSRFDKRNTEDRLNYTSIVLDACKDS